MKDLKFQGKRVLLRVDFNVPLNDACQITDDSRIVAALPTIRYLLEKGASLVLLSHLGRPKGVCPKMSLDPCAKALSKLIGLPVLMAKDCVGPVVEKMAGSLKPGEILMLENLRFHEAEEKPEKDPQFALQLSKLGDFYINDAFGTSHRAHSSIVPIVKYFQGKSEMGFLMENEIKHLTPLLHNPPSPFCAIIGGAKISTKIGVISRLIELVDVLYVGGAMAYTFFKAQGIEMGSSLVEESECDRAKQLLKNTKLRLPVDLVISDGKAVKTILVKEGIPTGWEGVDIGPQTVHAWSMELQKVATVFWNGPLGLFEKPPFEKGTHAIAEALSNSSAKVIVGGGDSVAAVQQMGLGSKFSYLSTGGGASLEFLEYGTLPGIDILSRS